MAIFSSPYPATYGVPVQPPQVFYPTPQPQSQAQNGIIWVKGEQGANNYNIAPNTTVALWDQDEEVIYLKEADQYGRPSMKVLEYKYRDTKEDKGSSPVNENYVSKDDFFKAINDLSNQIKMLNKKSRNLTED